MKNRLKTFTAIALIFLAVSPAFAETATKPKDEAPVKPRVRLHTARHTREARKYERRAKINAEYEPLPKKKPIKPAPKRQIRYPKDEPSPEAEEPKVNGLVNVR